MKISIKLTAIAAFALIESASFGQSLNMNVGYSLSTIKFDGLAEETGTEVDGSETYTYSTKIKSVGGVTASLGYEFKLGDRLSLETGLKFQSRGSKIESNYAYDSPGYSASQSTSTKLKMNYFDLPIVLNTAILTGDLRIYARTGIYLGAAIGGNYSNRTVYTSSDGDNATYEYSETMDSDDLDERLTGGFVLGIGAEYKGIYFETNFNMGALSLTNIDYEIYTNDLSFTLGYKLKFNK
jgi:hypothetical protein